MFPLRGLRIESPETEAFDHRSLIRSLEKFQGNAAIQDLTCRQPAAALAPASIAQGKAADRIPLAFEKIKLPAIRVPAFAKHIPTGLSLRLRSFGLLILLHARKT